MKKLLSIPSNRFRFILIILGILLIIWALISHLSEKKNFILSSFISDITVYVLVIFAMIISMKQDQVTTAVGIKYINKTFLLWILSMILHIAFVMLYFLDKLNLPVAICAGVPTLVSAYFFGRRWVKSLDKDIAEKKNI